MKQIVAKVISNTPVLPEVRRSHARTALGTRILWLSCPEIAGEAKPGQFVMVRCGESCTLPRPFSIFRVYGKGELALFFVVWQDGKGTEWLSQRRVGDTVEIFGPLGNSFTINPASRNLLLVAGGTGIAPINFLAHYATAQKINVTLLYGTPAQSRYPMPPELRVIPATDDGSVGYQGMVTDLIPRHIDHADQVFACGPSAMYRSMAGKKQELRLTGKPVQISLEVRMGCGVGACYGCSVKTTAGMKRVCKEGPVFDLADILWDELK